MQPLKPEYVDLNPALQEAFSTIAPHRWAAICPADEASALTSRRETSDPELAALTQNEGATEPDRKSALLRLVYRYMAKTDDYQLPGVEERLDRISASADQISYPTLRTQLKLLFKNIAALKGRRHSTSDSAQAAVPREKEGEMLMQTNSWSDIKEEDCIYSSEKVDGKWIRKHRGLTFQSDSGRAAAPNPIAAGAEAPREEEGIVPITLQVKDVEVVPEGQHEAVITRIEERQSKFEDSRSDTYLAVTFELTDGAHAGRQLTKGFSPVLSSKSNLGRLWKRLKGDLPVGQTVDVEELIGEHVQVIVTYSRGEDGELRERISEVFAPLAESASAREPVQAGVPF